MKQLAKDLLFSLTVGLVIPALLLQYAAVRNRSCVVDAPEDRVEEGVSVLPVKVRHSDGIVTEEAMDAYLTGVLLAEMPASFELEALKAQAVVARTYARKAYVTGGKHGDGSVCREAACCQGYMSETAYLENGGTEEAVQKIREAVYSTSPQVLCYQGELIEATYFSCSGGRTEDAVAVWGQDFPYLRSVESPGEEEASHYRDTVFLSREELESALTVSLTDDPQTWIGNVTYTVGDGVDTIVIGGKYFTGTELRSVLNLPSASFEILPAGQGVTITTKGYGHRVGMSQYGADAMAVTGSSYGSILSHYYPGTQLVLLVQENG